MVVEVNSAPLSIQDYNDPQRLKTLFFDDLTKSLEEYFVTPHVVILSHIVGYTISYKFAKC